MCIYGTRQTYYFSKEYEVKIDSFSSNGSGYEVAGTFSGVVYTYDTTTYDPNAVNTSILTDGTFDFTF